MKWLFRMRAREVGLDSHDCRVAISISAMKKWRESAFNHFSWLWFVPVGTSYSSPGSPSARRGSRTESSGPTAKSSHGNCARLLWTLLNSGFYCIREKLLKSSKKRSFIFQLFQVQRTLGRRRRDFRQSPHRARGQDEGHANGTPALPPMVPYNLLSLYIHTLS